MLQLVVSFIFLFVSISAQPDPLSGGKPLNPGVEFRLNKGGLDYANAEATRAFDRKLSNETAAPYLIPILNGEITIHQFHVDFISPEFVYELTKPNLVRWKINETLISANGQVEHIVFTPKRTQINGTVAIKGIIMELNTYSALSRGVDGRPTFLVLSCVARVTDVNATFSDETLIKPMSTITPKLETLIENTLCTSIKNFLNTDVNNYLKTFPNKPELGVPLGQNLGTSDKDLFVDYSLILNPAVEKDYLSFPLKGAVTSRQVASVPFFPQDMSEHKPGQMLDYFMSDYLLNTLFHVAHQQDFLNLTADPKLLSNLNAQNLRLKCAESELCLGNLFHNATFPSDAVAFVYFRTTQPPKAVFYVDSANWTAKGLLEIRVHTEGPMSKNLLLSAKVPIVSGSLVPKVYQNTISGSTQIKEITFEDIGDKNDFGTFDLSKTGHLNVIVSSLLEELVNGFLSIGFTIPLPYGIHLSNPMTHIFPRTFVVDNDLVYNGS